MENPISYANDEKKANIAIFTLQNKLFVNKHYQRKKYTSRGQYTNYKIV